MCSSTWDPKPPYVAQLGPCVPQLGLSRPIFGPTRRPRGLPSRFWSDFGPLREGLEAQKHCKIHGFGYISRSATDIVQIVQISPWEVPKPPPTAPRSGPGCPGERPKSAPRAAQTRLPNGPGGEVGPNWHKRAVRRPPGDHFGLPTGRFCTLRGSIFGQVSLSESIAKAVLWAKLAQAYTQHRFTSLCNFYIWISTATDNRSRSTHPCMNR